MDQSQHRDRLRRGKRTLQVIAGEIDTAIDHVKKHSIDQPVTCEKGCSHCCYQMITATPAEGIGAVQYLAEQGRLREIDMDRLRDDVNMLFEDGMNMDKWWRLRRPCTFLADDGTCKVYPARPYPCRTHLVVSDPFQCSPENTQKGLTLVVDTRQVDHYAMDALGGACDAFDVMHTMVPWPLAIMWGLAYYNDGADGLRKRNEGTPFNDPYATLKYWTKLEFAEDGKTFVLHDDGGWQCRVCKCVHPERSDPLTCPRCGSIHGESPDDLQMGANI